MLLMLVLLVAIWLTIMRQPDTPIAKAVWRLTVIRPIDWANGLRRGHVLITVLLIVTATIAVYCIGRESAQLFAMGAPDIGLWLVSFDIATYVDALAVVTLAASTMRMKATWSRLKTWLPMRRHVARRRERRTHGDATRRIAPSNDDDERCARVA